MFKVSSLKFKVLLLLAAFGAGASAADKSRGLAIVVDPASLRQAKSEIDAYANAIEQRQGLKTFIVEDRWGVPDSIRACLERMHRQKEHPIEGAVLVGDIPVAMIRDAQHLTSAFKMNQTQPRKESSVPSDRYYDDFGMKFDYIDRDSDNVCFYYSLRADSRQQLRSDIYTGRIRPTDCGGTSRYEKLRRYLRKATAEKMKDNKVDQILYFSGHGYISESMTARIDEKQGLYEHFPWLKQQQNGIGFIDHSQEDVIKFRLMNELMRPDLDYAILHHHGAPDTQYMNGWPEIRTAEKAQQVMKSYMRGYLRHAKERGKNVDSVKQVLMKRFDVPSSWIDNTFDADITAKDSLDDDNSDLHLTDFKTYGYRPNCRVVMIDACFNGSYHLDDCIADEYIFQEGKTIVAIANSVNVLQDKWSDRYMGLLGIGMNVGNIARFCGYLESQCIGDPTFRFTTAGIDSKHKADRIDINEMLANADSKRWRKALGHPMADVQSMAIEQLYRRGDISSSEVLDIFKTTPFAIVRIQALTTLAEMRDDNFIEALKLAANDSYEMVQRLALRYISQSGDERLIPALMRVCISNNTSERVNFNSLYALSVYQEEKLMKEFERQFDSDDVAYYNKAEVRKTIEKAIRNSAKRWDSGMSEMMDETAKPKARRFAVRSTRNYMAPWRAPQVMQLAEQTKDTELQTMIIESLGWRRCAYNWREIAEWAKGISQNTNYAEAVRQEALKTYNRLAF